MSEDEIITEFENRQARLNNLILYNMEESAKEEANERKDDDMMRCKNILWDNLENNTNIQIKSCIRLGIFNVGKNSLIRIML